MTHVFSGKKTRRIYRYYRCTNALKNGHDACPSGSIPAREIEKVVMAELREMVNDESLVAHILSEARAEVKAELMNVCHDRADLIKEQKRFHRELKDLVLSGKTGAEATNRIVWLQEQLNLVERRLLEIESRIASLKEDVLEDNDTVAALKDFDEIWDTLNPREQARILRLLISVVEYDGKAGTVSVTFRATNIKTLAKESLEGAA